MSDEKIHKHEWQPGPIVIRKGNIIYADYGGKDIILVCKCGETRRERVE